MIKMKRRRPPQVASVSFVPSFSVVIRNFRQKLGEMIKYLYLCPRKPKNPNNYGKEKKRNT